MSNFENNVTLQILPVRFSDPAPLEAGLQRDCGSPARNYAIA